MQTFPQYLAPGVFPDRMSQGEKALKRLQQSSGVAASIICSDIAEARKAWGKVPADEKAKAAKSLDLQADEITTFSDSLITACEAKPKPANKPKSDK